MSETKKFQTIKYFKAEQLKSVTSVSDNARKVLDQSAPTDNIAVLLSINSPLKIEKAVNINKEGFEKIKDLIPIN